MLPELGLLLLLDAKPKSQVGVLNIPSKKQQQRSACIEEMISH